MLANYYKTAVRNFARNRFHTLINIIGLSIGIAFTLLIAAYCWSENQVNRQLRNADRQFILTSEWTIPGSGYPVSTAGPLAKTLWEKYPSMVADYYRFDAINVVVSNGDKYFREGIQIADSTLLPMFGFPLLNGDARTALNSPFTVVITDEKAIKFFGTTDVVGKDLTIDNFSGEQQAFRITAVMKRPPRNSITQILPGFENGIFVPVSNLTYFGQNMNWNNSSIASFIELRKGVDPESLRAPIAQILKTNFNPDLVGAFHVLVQPLHTFYLDANGGVVRTMLYTLSFIALFIMGMALINFINLSVSRSSTRMKEIGIRKVMGGLRSQLRAQFLTESILLALFSTIVALLLYALLSPLLGDMLGRQLPSLLALPVAAWGLILLFALVTGWLAGLYPATLLSSLSSVDALRARIGTVQGKTLLRKGLVGFQFATATVAFIGVIIISQQVRLFFSDQLGYNKDFVLSATLPRDWTAKGVQNMEAIRAIFAGMPEVKDVTLSCDIPNGRNFMSFGAYRENGDSSHCLAATGLLTDSHYATTYEIPLAAGVYFHIPGEDDSRDSTHLVINETAAKELGWNAPRDAVGQRLRLWGQGTKMFTVSGVVKDFHFAGMNRPITPEVIGPISVFTTYRYLSFKLKPGNVVSTIAALQAQWDRLMPGAPFEYKFMDESLEAIYTNERRLQKAASTATALTAIIVLLGVIGLVSSSLRRRTKEMAIRKVIGASTPSILRLFVREYLPVLLLAGLVASPLAYWIMHRWLNDYVTRITITVWPFVVAIGCLAIVMIGLILVQTIPAAKANPVKALRSE